MKNLRDLVHGFGKPQATKNGLIILSTTMKMLVVVVQLKYTFMSAYNDQWIEVVLCAEKLVKKCQSWEEQRLCFQALPFVSLVRHFQQLYRLLSATFTAAGVS